MVQETFLKFCRQAKNDDASPAPVRAWLFTIAQPAAYDIARRPSSRPMGRSWSGAWPAWGKMDA